MKIVLEDILKEKQKIALGGHVRPDGDCVGSCMGLYLYLKEQYPQISADVYLETVPEAYRMIAGTDEVKSQLGKKCPMIFLSVWTVGIWTVWASRSRCSSLPGKQCASIIISAMKLSRI